MANSSDGKGRAPTTRKAAPAAAKRAAPKARSRAAGTASKPKPAPPTVPNGAEALTEHAIEQAGRTTEQVRDLGQALDSARRAEIGATANDSNIVNELQGGGVAFGDFVKSVGLGVAAAQTELDKTLVATAKALSEVEINTVAVFEQQIKDDDGSMDRGEYHIQKLPLTNYLMPTVYQWSRVYLEADMNVEEFNSRSGFDIQSKAFAAGGSVGGSVGLFGWNVNGSAYSDYRSSNTNADVANSTDRAAGKLHMEATLEPRSDIERFPRPYVLQKGPRLQLVVGGRVPIHEGNDAKKPVVGQKVELVAVLQATNGSPNADKPLSVSVSEPTLNYETTGKTDADGNMKVTLTRQGAVYDPTSPVRAVVRVSFGLVAQAVGIVM